MKAYSACPCVHLFMLLLTPPCREAKAQSHQYTCVHAHEADAAQTQCGICGADAAVQVILPVALAALATEPPSSVLGKRMLHLMKHCNMQQKGDLCCSQLFTMCWCRENPISETEEDDESASDTDSGGAIQFGRWSKRRLSCPT